MTPQERRAWVEALPPSEGTNVAFSLLSGIEYHEADAKKHGEAWKTFTDVGLLWWVNRSLHLFGWAIVVTEESNGDISDVRVGRVKYRGFSQETEEVRFLALTRYLAENSKELQEEIK